MGMERDVVSLARLSVDFPGHENDGSSRAALVQEQPTAWFGPASEVEMEGDTAPLSRSTG